MEIPLQTLKRLKCALRDRARRVWAWLSRDPGDGSDPWLNVFKRVTVVAGSVVAIGAVAGLVWSLGARGYATITSSADIGSVGTSTVGSDVPPSSSDTLEPEIQPPATESTTTTSTSPAPSTSVQPQKSLSIEDVRIGSEESRIALDVAVLGGAQPSVLTAIGVHEYFLNYALECGGHQFVELAVDPFVDLAVGMEGDVAVVAPQREGGDTAKVDVAGDWSSVGGCSTRTGLVMRPQAALNSSDVLFLDLSLPLDYEIESAVVTGTGSVEPIPVEDFVDGELDYDQYLPGGTFELFHEADDIDPENYPCCAVILVVSVSDSLGACDLYLVDLAPREGKENIVNHFDRVVAGDLPPTCP